MSDKNSIKYITGLVVLIIAVVVSIIFVLRSSALNRTPTPITKSNKTVTTIEQTAVITASATGFSPSTIQVEKGKKIVWINKSGTTISINSDDHPTHKKFPLLNFGEVPNGSSAQTTLDQAGTYTYHNHLKPDQKGTIIVK